MGPGVQTLNPTFSKPYVQRNRPHHALRLFADVSVRNPPHIPAHGLSRSTYTAKVLGGDVARDVAVLRLSMPKSRMRELQPCELGSSSGLAIGQAVYGIGERVTGDATGAGAGRVTVVGASPATVDSEATCVHAHAHAQGTPTGSTTP